VFRIHRNVKHAKVPSTGNKHDSGSGKSWKTSHKYYGAKEDEEQEKMARSKYEVDSTRRSVPDSPNR